MDEMTIKVSKVAYDVICEIKQRTKIPIKYLVENAVKLLHANLTNKKERDNESKSNPRREPQIPQ